MCKETPEKLLITLDSAGHLRAFAVRKSAETQKMLEAAFLQLNSWDDDAQQAVNSFDYDNIEFLLAEAGFPVYGRNLFVDVEAKIDVNSLV